MTNTTLSTLLVNPGERKVIDFTHFDIAEARGLEDDIAVATRLGMIGTLSHMRLTDDLGQLFDFIDTYVPKDSQIYLIGGRRRTDPDSECFGAAEYLEWITRTLEKSGYTITGRSVLQLGNHGKDVRMLADPPAIDIYNYRLIRTPSGPQRFPLVPEQYT